MGSASLAKEDEWLAPHWIGGGESFGVAYSLDGAHLGHMSGCSGMSALRQLPLISESPIGARGGMGEEHSLCEDL